MVSGQGVRLPPHLHQERKDEMSKSKYVIRECCHLEFIVKMNDDSELGEGVEASFMGPSSKERAEEYMKFLERKEDSKQVTSTLWDENYRSMGVAEFFNLLAYKTAT